MKPTLAIDIDGTLVAWPAVFGPLARDLAAAGWQVFLLTGGVHAHPDQGWMQGQQALRRAQVAALVDGEVEIAIVTGVTPADIARAKARVCKERGVNLFVDDSSENAVTARRESPATCVLGVWP